MKVRLAMLKPECNCSNLPNILSQFFGWEVPFANAVNRVRELVRANLCFINLSPRLSSPFSAWPQELEALKWMGTMRVRFAACVLAFAFR